MEKTKHLLYTTVVGNILEHYDKVLFSLIAPFIAPFFFPNSDPIVALILIYLPMGLIMRPLGALYWGYIGDRWGRKRVLSASLLGMSLTMLFIGLLPTYSSMGIFSSIFLHLGRGLSSFFAAGEVISAPLILIENTSEENQDLASSYYEMSSMIGVLLASSLISWLCYQGTVLSLWRWLFILSGTLGLIGLWMRRNLFFEEELQNNVSSPFSLIPLIKTHATPFIAITLLTGFLCANYLILTKLLNGFIPLISTISKGEMMGTHTVLILFDFLLIPCFGLLSKKVGRTKLISWALGLASLGVFPLFYLLLQPSLSTVLWIRIILALWGIAITAPFNSWSASLLPKEDRFRIISIARALGSEGIGALAIPFSLFIFHKTNWIASPAIIIFLSATCSLGAIFLIRKKKKIAFG